MTDKTAKHGEIPTTLARWGEIESDARLHIPTDVLSGVDWYVSGKRCDVLIELRERGSFLIHGGAQIAEITEKRKLLFLEHADKVESLRRIAISHAQFLQAAIGQSNRRITLPVSILSHLGVTKPARVLCLAYAGRIEVLSEERANTLMGVAHIDINVDL